MKSKWDDEAKFVKVHGTEAEMVVPLLQERQLLPRDLAVLMVMVIRASWKSGLVRTTAAKLAKDMGMVDKDVISSITRLRKMLVLTRFKDEDGLPCYLLNPWCFSVGTTKEKAFRWQQFQQSLE